MSLRPVIFFTLMLVLLTGCQSIDRLDINRRLALAFDELVFDRRTNENASKLYYQNKYLRRWEGTVPVILITNGVDWPDDLPRFDVILSEISWLTGRPFTWDGQYWSEDDAEVPPSIKGVTVIFDGADKYLVAKNRLALCGTIPVYKNQQLLRMTIRVPARHPSFVVDCFLHEMMHALGLLGHSWRLPSVLGDTKAPTMFTLWDKILIRALYDPVLAAGDSRERSLQRVKAVISQQIRRLVPS